MYLEEEVFRVNEILKQLFDKKNIVIWGAADNTAYLFRYTNILSYPILVVDKGKAGQSFFGKEIKHPNEIRWEKTEAVVISSFHYEDEIAKELIDIYHFEKTITRLYADGQERPFYEHLSWNELQVDKKYREYIIPNSKFKGIHKGERLFVLCSGPSVAQMNLKKLRNEFSIAVNGFYVHEDFGYIHPNYYCAGHATRDLGKGADFFYDELDKHLIDIECFFCINDKCLIESKHFFEGRNVNYYQLFKSGKQELFEDIDLTLSLMDVQSLSILCLQIAIYMEFSEIYLIGTEHDYILTGKYGHFYKRVGTYSEYDKSVVGDDECIIPFQNKVIEINRLWDQYKIVKEIAERKGIKIYNATQGGILDVFERVDYDSLF